MNIKEYAGLLPDVDMEKEDKDAIEYFLNEFIKNNVGTNDLIELTEYFEANTAHIDVFGEKKEYNSLESFVRGYFELYKNMVDNPFVQDTLPSYDAAKDVEIEKFHASFFDD